MMLFTDRASIILNSDTIDVLRQEGKLADPFRRYGITHILGYDAARSALIRAAAPAVTEIPFAASSVPLTPFKKYLLNLLR